MQITCYYDQNTWKVQPLPIAVAKVRFGLGAETFSFICPKCRRGNLVSGPEFQAALAAGSRGHITGRIGSPARGFGGVGGRAGREQPQAGPGPAVPGSVREGVVIVRSLHVRKDHSTRSETMAGLRRGDRVRVLGTWTDGKNTWAKLGPDRWAAIRYNDVPLIEITD